jgi:hypothetical protein
MIALRRLPRLLRPAPHPARTYCELDRWYFDPRYTQGRCPICGWAPPGAPSYPRWMVVAGRIDWELFGLLLLADILVLAGLVVARAAGLIR